MSSLHKLRLVHSIGIIITERDGCVGNKKHTPSAGSLSKVSVVDKSKFQTELSWLM